MCMTSTEQINPMTKDQAARLYDFLHAQWGEARDAYLAAEHASEEEFHRGRREAIDDVLSQLDSLMDEETAR